MFVCHVSKNWMKGTFKGPSPVFFGKRETPGFDPWTFTSQALLKELRASNDCPQEEKDAEDG